MFGVKFIYAQSPDSTNKKEKNHLQAGVQYISNQTYAGRTDSLKLPVVVPSVNLRTPVGFYVKARGYFNLSKNNRGFDGISIEPGYEFSKNNWNGSIALIKNFINDSSNLIIAPVKTSLEFYLGNQNKIITPYVGAEYLFTSEGNDFIVYGGLAKSFTVTHAEKEPSVSIEPSLSLTGGTQTFYYSFLKTYAGNNRSRERGRNNNVSVPVTQKVKGESKQFTLLAVQFEIPITLTKGKFEWKTTPAWESPINLVNNGSPGTQQSKSYIYISTEFLFTF